MASKRAQKAAQAARIARLEFAHLAAGQAPPTKAFIEAIANALTNDNPGNKIPEVVAEMLMEISKELSEDEARDIELLGIDLSEKIFQKNKEKGLNTGYLYLAYAVSEQIMSAARGQPLLDARGREIAL